MIVYKVCRRKSKNPAAYKPAVANTKDCYEINKWCSPKIGKIFVFSNYIDAARFKYFEETPSYPLFVVECEARKIDHAPKYILYLEYITSDTLTNFWKRGKSFDRMPVPNNSYVCNSIKILREVE